MAEKLKRIKFTKKVAKKSSKEIIENIKQFENNLPCDLYELEELKIQKQLELDDIKFRMGQRPKEIISDWVLFWSIITILITSVAPAIVDVIGSRMGGGCLNIEFTKNILSIILFLFYVVGMWLGYTRDKKKYNSGWKLSIEEYKQLELEVEIIENRIMEIKGKNNDYKVVGYNSGRCNYDFITIKHD